MQVIGYGICGPGESGRYMRETMEEFKRLCDRVVILCNNAGVGEYDLIREYGFDIVEDEREWGRLQWKIKQEFMEEHIAPIASIGDVMVCLDMDERFHRSLSKDWLRRMPFDAYKVFIVDLWNDDKHYKPVSCFWNTRIWRWNGNIEWWAKPVHCGLSPKWAVAYNRYAPFILVHKGLMAKSDRDRKIKRYEKYDPHARHLAKPYYAMLHSDAAEPFDEDAIQDTISDEVATYKQSKPRSIPFMAQPKGRFAYVTNPGGITVDIPEKQLAETLKRPGFTFIGWADEAEREMEELFDEGDILEGDEDAPKPTRGSYQRSTRDEKAELDQRNKTDDADIDDLSPRDEADKLPEVGESTTARSGSVLRNRLGFKENDAIRQAKKNAESRKTAAKKSTKKAKK